MEKDGLVGKLTHAFHLKKAASDGKEGERRTLASNVGKRKHLHN